MIMSFLLSLEVPVSLGLVTAVWLHKMSFKMNFSIKSKLV